jgi:hypothetical protein
MASTATAPARRTLLLGVGDGTFDRLAGHNRRGGFLCAVLGGFDELLLRGIGI